MATLISQLRLLQRATQWLHPHQPIRDRAKCGSDGSGGRKAAPGSQVHTAQVSNVRFGRSWCARTSATTTSSEPQGAGFNQEGRKSLAHPDFHVIQSWWHPTKNSGKLPGDFTRKSHKYIWLRCLGCKHGCGRHHEWKARVKSLTESTEKGGSDINCPSCASMGGKFCPCQSVASDPRLSGEWHLDNPPAGDIVRSARAQYLWQCPVGHPPYTASCNSRSHNNSGCPVCGNRNRSTTRHPVTSVGRPDLAQEWDTNRNTRVASEVTLGSTYIATWICSNNAEHPPWQAPVYTRALHGNGCPACKFQNRYKTRIFGASHELG